ncbi:hypothetical protein C8R45DRAFT_932409 [Mycena sanguinolenta]|nr:hypothetical protein C8R45DRAFT_932409 [Mycena sanguinolenta]
MSQTTATSTTHLSAAQQRLLATPLGRYFGQDVLSLAALFPGTQLSAMAEALEDENHDIYATLKAAGLLKNGEIQTVRDIAIMPTDGPEAAEIKFRPIPSTKFAIRQYQLDIGSHPDEVDRQGFLFDFYDTARGVQLAPVPKGYTFSVAMFKTAQQWRELAADDFSQMAMQPVVLGPHGTTMAVRGVYFEVKRGTELLLKFTARDL